MNLHRLASLISFFVCTMTLWGAETLSSTTGGRPDSAPPSPATTPEIISSAMLAPAFTFSEYLVASIRIHFLTSSTEPDLQTILSESDLRRILPKMNRVWSQAGIAFTVESFIHEPAAALAPDADGESHAPAGSGPWLRSHIPQATYSRKVFNVYYVKQFFANGVYLGDPIFVKDTASLRAVKGGIDEPIPRVSSHELGHALGLPHRQDTFNLMASGTTGTLLNAEEIEIARAHALSSGRFTRASDLLASAQALLAQGCPDRAELILRELADLPLVPDDLTAIQALIEQNFSRSKPSIDVSP